MAHLSESTGDLRLDVLRFLVESYDFRRRLRLKATEPVKDLNQHFQSILLRAFHQFPCLLCFPLIHATPLLKVLLLECDQVIEEESRSVFESLWDSVVGEVERDSVWNIREQEGNVTGQAFGEESGQGREYIVHANRDTRDGTVGEDENGTDDIEVILYFNGNALFVEGVLMKTPSISQSRRIEDANLGKCHACLQYSRTSLLTDMPFSLESS